MDSRFVGVVMRFYIDTREIAKMKEGYHTAGVVVLHMEEFYKAGVMTEIEITIPSETREPTQLQLDEDQPWIY